MMKGLGVFNARLESRQSSWSSAILSRRVASEARWTTRKSNTSKGIEGKFKDHKGNSFATLKEMCEHWGISVRLFFKRTAMGYSLMRVLTTDVKLGAFSQLIAGRNAKQVTDHEGTVFQSVSALCKHWGISMSTYNQRIKKGMSVKEALLTPIKQRKKKSDKTMSRAKTVTTKNNIVVEPKSVATIKRSDFVYADRFGYGANGQLLAVDL